MDLIDQIVEAMLQRRKDEPSPYPQVAVLDCDWSVILGDCFEAVLKYMARNKDEFPDAQEHFDRYYSLLDLGKMEAAYRFGPTILQGLTAAKVDEIVRETMKYEGTEITTELLPARKDHPVARGIAPRKNVVELARRLRAWGIDVWIVSASPELVVRPTLEYFGLHTLVTDVIGIRNIVGDDGVITGKLEEPVSIFEGKVACIKERVGEILGPLHETVRPLIGVGDSMNDHPMLLYSQLRVVVDRGNPLAQAAKANGWFILS